MASLLAGFVLGSYRQHRNRAQESFAQLENANAKLTEALKQVKRLSGLLPVCASCKRVRTDTGYWQQIDEYIHLHSEVSVSHSICPECTKALYPDLDL